MQRPRAGMAEAASALIIRPTSAAARKGGALAPPHTMCQSPLACDSERQRLGAAEAEQSVWFVRRLGAIGQSQRARRQCTRTLVGPPARVRPACLGGPGSRAGATSRATTLVLGATFEAGVRWPPQLQRKRSLSFGVVPPGEA